MLTYGSLFSGAGGFELGFNKLGWDCLWMCEKDKFARGVLSFNFPSVPLYEDVAKLRGGRIQPVDVICGGFPCQDLSIAGKKGGLGAKRSGLFYDFVRIVDEMREETNGEFPKAVIWENVPGLISKTQDWISDIYTAWGEIGAVVQEHRVVDAQYFGVPQRRRRIIGVVVFDPRGDGGPEILSDSESGAGGTGSGHEKRNQSKSPPTSGAGRYSPTLSGPFPTIIAFHLKQDPIAATVSPALGVSSGGMGITGHGNLGDLWARKLTPLECERLMGWPDNWTARQSIDKFTSDSQRYKMCGNGLVAQVATWAGARIERVLDNENV